MEKNKDDKKQNKDKKNKKGNIIYCLAMSVIIIISVGGCYFKYNQKLELDNQIRELEQQIAEANKTNEELKKETQYKASDEYIEKMARETLGMVKPNEIIFIVNNN